jgi:hypothetical protein
MGGNIMYLKEFKQDLEKARTAEYLVFMLLKGADSAHNYKFEWVGDNRDFYDKGDIKAINVATGKEIFIEVKDDSRIADTGNILCEERVDYIWHSNIGNIYSAFDVYTIVSKKENKVYVLDGKILKEIYKKYGCYKYIEHPHQSSEVYLLPLYIMKKQGGLLATIDYDLNTRRAKIA